MLMLTNGTRGEAERQSSPTAAGTRRWQRIQRMMNRCARTGNGAWRFVWSDLLGHGNPLLLIKINNIPRPKTESSATGLEIVNANADALHTATRKVDKTKTR